jgi:hypothetical protein
LLPAIMELQVPQELKQLGVGLWKEGQTIVVKYGDYPIRFEILRDWNKTIRVFHKKVDDIISDKQLIQRIEACLSGNYSAIIQNTGSGRVNEVAEELERIPRPDITPEEWQGKLVEKYNNLRCTVKESLPNLWLPLEFSLSIKCILNIKDCNLPFAGFILGAPSSLKTQDIELFRRWPQTFYTDSFTAKSFVSHSTAVKADELADIDMLPKIKNKLFLTPELAPTFAAKDDDLVQSLGIMTRILDGHGYESDSGAHGHRGYHEEVMFTWIGAAVDIPRKVHKYLGTLGPKLYFLRLPKAEKTEDDYYRQIRSDDFAAKINDIHTALFDYLKWFEAGPNLVNENGLPKMQWNNEKDDEDALRYIIRLARLLGHLRGVVPTWETKDTQGLDYAYTVATIEEPDRAITQLKNLARGRALSQGRNYITLEDVPIIVKVVLSTASIERVKVFDLLLRHNGMLDTSDITNGMNTTKPTALRTMAELKALELVDLVELGEGDNTLKQIQLKHDFEWFLTEGFKDLRKNFEPADNREYLKRQRCQEEDEQKSSDTTTIAATSSPAEERKENLPPTGKENFCLDLWGEQANRR